LTRNMSSWIETVTEKYNEILEYDKDPIVDSWFLMNSPFPMLIILAVYLGFVLKWGPEWMKNKRAVEMKNILIAYNLYQVLFSLWICSNVFVIKGDLHLLFTLTCSNPNSQSPLKNLTITSAWWYFFSKIVDLLDTVFFVLRKKQSQVTFLHVYHHSIMVLFTWAYLKLFPGELGLLIGFLNSFVHVIMYFYYFLAALGPAYKKYLWWKKYMTWIQLGQFCIMLAYLFVTMAMDCKQPKALTFFFVGNIVIFLYLFARFYRNAYMTTKSEDGVAQTHTQIMKSALKLN